MAKLKVREVQELAKRIVAQSAGGVRYSEIVGRVHTEHPETPRNTIHGAVWDLDKTFPGEVSKPSRGLFVMQDAKGAKTAKTEAIEAPSRVKESDFYESFANWLKHGLDEVTEASALGGSSQRNKWGTPDVLGTFRPLGSDRVKFEIEIVAAELKVNPHESITAFGQAIAYRLFSHKVYLVMPADVPEEDQSRIEALGLLFGVGIVQFDLNPEEPGYRVRLRAQRFSPDMWYVNEFAERLHDHDKKAFNKLFP
jgi:hypothetical protein